METHCDFKNGLKLPHSADNYTEATIAVIGRLLGGRGGWMSCYLWFQFRIAFVTLSTVHTVGFYKAFASLSLVLLQLVLDPSLEHR